MKWKLIAVDIDGTLLTDELKLTSENEAAISKAMSMGVQVVLCSGRSTESIKYVAKGIKNMEHAYIIGFNGGETLRLDQAATIEQILLTKEDAMATVSFIQKWDKNVVPLVYLDAETAVAEADHEFLRRYTAITNMKFQFSPLKSVIDKPVSKVVVLGESENMDSLQVAIKKMLPKNLHCFRSTPTLLEFAPQLANKGDALRRLTNSLGILMEEVVSIGDAENDLSMIEKAGKGVAVSNAAEILREKADYITKQDNNHSAVAAVIHWVLGENNKDC